MDMVKANNYRIIVLTFFLLCCVFKSTHFICLAQAAAPSFQKDQEISLSSKTDDSSTQREVIWQDEDEAIEENDKKNIDYRDEDLREETEEVPDPLEPFNRAMFKFNDKFYFWLLKPVSSAYGTIFPKPVRDSVGKFFSNLLFPQRFINCLLQANFKGAGKELSRFTVNTTIGIGGLFDPATSQFKIKKQEEDFGQTFGRYGIGEGAFIIWPILGPSTLRDSLGMTGDYFLNPISYVEPFEAYLAIHSDKTVNNTSLKLGDYEALKDEAIDPYFSIRDGYIQYRKKKVEEKN